MQNAPLRAPTGVAAILALGCGLSIAAAADQTPINYTLKANQTFGFGNDRLPVFTHDENFDCVDQPPGYFRGSNGHTLGFRAGGSWESARQCRAHVWKGR